MLNPVEELKKYNKINIIFDQQNNMTQSDDTGIERALISEINKLSKNQFKAVQKIDALYDEVIQMLEEKMDK